MPSGSKNKQSSSSRNDGKRDPLQNDRADNKKKKRKKDEEDDEDLGKEQQVDFDFCDPAEEDFHIVKALVHKMVDGKDFDSSVLSDLIISDLTAFWRKHAKDSDSEGKLTAALDSNDAAVLISERVVNAPAELATPLIAGIVREQQQCVASGDKELLPHGAVKHVLHCALAYIDSGTAANELGAVPVTAGQSSKTEEAAGDVVFMRPEDEFMHSRAKWSCQWEVPQEGRYSEHSKRVRILMGLTTAGVKKALVDMASMFNHDLTQHEVDV